jgi:subtilase family serine protease
MTSWRFENLTRFGQDRDGEEIGNVTVLANIISHNAPAGEFVVQLKVDGKTVANHTVTSLDEEGTAAVRLVWDGSDDDPGEEHKFEVVLDTEESVDETDENNNEREAEFKVGQAPEMEKYIRWTLWIAIPLLLVAAVVVYLTRRK